MASKRLTPPTYLPLRTFFFQKEENADISEHLTGILRQTVQATTGVGPILPDGWQQQLSWTALVATVAHNLQEAVEEQVKGDIHKAVQKAGDQTKDFLSGEKTRIGKISLIPIYGLIKGMPPAHPSCPIPSRAPSHCRVSPTAPIEVSKLKARAQDLFHSLVRAKIATLVAEYKTKPPILVHRQPSIDKLLASQAWKDFILTVAKDKAAKEA